MGVQGSGPNGSRFRKVKQLRARDEVPELLQRLHCVPDVYFFDSYEAGPRTLANELRLRGSLIYFEAEGCKEMSKLAKAIELADIVKFSNENVPSTDFCEAPDKLFIQTMGAEGLQFKLRGGDWIYIPPVSVEKVVDWEGCGDTITATFINELGKQGLPEIASISAEQVKLALECATKQAAVCTQYLGAKGWCTAILDT